MDEETLYGRLCKAEYFDWSSFTTLLEEDTTDGKPCHTCVAKYTCENLECKSFKQWVEDGVDAEKPEGFTEDEVINMFPQLTRRKLQRLRESVPYEVWRHKCVYTDIEAIKKSLEDKKPEGMLNAAELIDVTGITKIKLKWLLQQKKIQADSKVEGKNYFHYKRIKEVMLCVL